MFHNKNIKLNKKLNKKLILKIDSKTQAGLPNKHPNRLDKEEQSYPIKGVPYTKFEILHNSFGFTEYNRQIVEYRLKSIKDLQTETETYTDKSMKFSYDVDINKHQFLVVSELVKIYLTTLNKYFIADKSTLSTAYAVSKRAADIFKAIDYTLGFIITENKADVLPEVYKSLGDRIDWESKPLIVQTLPFEEMRSYLSSNANYITAHVAIDAIRKSMNRYFSLPTNLQLDLTNYISQLQDLVVDILLSQENDKLRAILLPITTLEYNTVILGGK